MKKIALVITMIMFVFCISFAQADMILNLPLDNQNAEDVSGNGNDGEMYGSLSPVEDRHGHPDGAIYFDGNKDYIVIPLTESYDIQEEYTISFWIKRAVSNHNSFIMYSSNVYLRLEGDHTSVPGRIMNGNSVCLDNPVDEWIHIVATAKSGDRTVIYRNGEFIDESPKGTASLVPTMHLAIGARHNSAITDHDFTGALDDIMVFNHVLNEDEIAELAGLETEPEKECVPVSEIPACEVCEEPEICPEPVVCDEPVVCEECEECPTPDCYEPDEVITGAVKKTKIQMMSHKDLTKVQLHLNAAGIPSDLDKGPVQVRVQFIQSGVVTEFVGDAELFGRAGKRNVEILMNKHHKEKKNCKYNKGKGKKHK